MSKNNLYDVICRCDEETRHVMAMADIMWAFSCAADDDDNTMDLCTIQEGIRHISHTLWNSGNALKAICEELQKISNFAEGSGNMCEETKNDKITTEELIKLFCQLSENDKQTVRNFISSIKSSSNSENADQKRGNFNVC